MAYWYELAQCNTVSYILNFLFFALHRLKCCGTICVCSIEVFCYSDEFENHLRNCCNSILYMAHNNAAQR